MDKANIQTNLPDVVKPEDFKSIQELQEVYEGMLKQYEI